MVLRRRLCRIRRRRILRLRFLLTGGCSKSLISIVFYSLYTILPYSVLVMIDTFPFLFYFSFISDDVQLYTSAFVERVEWCLSFFLYSLLGYVYLHDNGI